MVKKYTVGRVVMAVALACAPVMVHAKVEADKEETASYGLSNRAKAALGTLAVTGAFGVAYALNPEAFTKGFEQIGRLFGRQPEPRGLMGHVRRYAGATKSYLHAARLASLKALGYQVAPQGFMANTRVIYLPAVKAFGFNAYATVGNAARQAYTVTGNAVRTAGTALGTAGNYAISTAYAHPYIVVGGLAVTPVVAGGYKLYAHQAAQSLGVPVTVPIEKQVTKPKAAPKRAARRRRRCFNGARRFGRAGARWGR